MTDASVIDSQSQCRNIVYALHRDDSDRIYIGKSSRGLRRAREHGMASYLKRECNARRPVSKWIQKGLLIGQKYTISILEECTSHEELAEAEIFHIAYMRFIGMRLLNCTDGGEGVPGLKLGPWSAERKAKFIAAKIGYKHSAEACANMAASRKGKPRSLQFKENLRRARLGLKPTLKWLDKMAIGGSCLPVHIHEFGAEAFRAWRRSIKMTAIVAASIIGVKPGVIYDFENRGLRKWKRRHGHENT